MAEESSRYTPRAVCSVFVSWPRLPRVRPVLQVRRDRVRALRAFAADTNVLASTAQRLTDFDRPVLVVWETGDQVMPPEHGRRLAELFPEGQLVAIDES